MNTPVEVPLQGGNMNEGVVRVGDTVRRPAGPWTPAVHALLGHLHDCGFEGAPRPLGLDERGREVLTFVPGEVLYPALPDDDGLRRVGRLIRDFHDAVAGFVPPADARWQALVPTDGDEIIAHCDLAPWNLVTGAGGLTFIDWDVASPATRLWDLAYACHGFVPLASYAGEPAHRLRVLADAYGLDERQRIALVPLLARRSMAMYDFLAEQSALGVQPWTRHWAEGHGDSWRGDAEFTARHEDRWRRALLD
ncbi:phosphotransferase enzyme family protein [Paractinoplanes rishiriensis]|uniref:Trifolitoxin immunity protein n=1 Tax=Paractinoplanes rishiriensis TaxID=1050105 RepID=A0A919MTL6_9ACTN|nr:phosphotransferase [Actinoplanes rishiriensis]GIE99381.1 trifolitoxin immunity protein [Actinoplanes rishiriensis]